MLVRIPMSIVASLTISKIGNKSKVHQQINEYLKCDMHI